MLEGVRSLWIERLLVEELAPHERIERGGDLRCGQLGHVPQDGLGELLADHRRGLQDRLLTLAQAIDARCQHRLHGAGQGLVTRRDRQPVRTLAAMQMARLDQPLHDLLDEERIARGALSDPIAKPPK
jgi:hypothetical protein